MNPEPIYLNFARQDIEKLHPAANTIMVFSFPDGQIFRYRFRNKITDRVNRTNIVRGQLQVLLPQGFGEQLLAALPQQPTLADQFLLAAFPTFQTQVELIPWQELLVIPTHLQSPKEIAAATQVIAKR